MKGSSESGWQKSDDARVYDTPATSGTDMISLHAKRLSFSADALCGCQPRKDMNHNSLAQSDRNDFMLHPSGYCESTATGDGCLGPGEGCNVSLRQWLETSGRPVDALQCVNIFRQIVDIINESHTQGIGFKKLQPSCFAISTSNHVSLIESVFSIESGSASCGAGQRSNSASARNLQVEIKSSNHCEQPDDGIQPLMVKNILLLERTWYISPEEVAGAPSSPASDVFRLGVLCFELFYPCNSRVEKCATMSSLRHRVFPPQFLLRWPKVVSFCLWLLHPDPASRPQMGELLESDFFYEANGSLEDCESERGLSEQIQEKELLLEFLLLSQKRKEEAARKLQESISLILFDIDEVISLQPSMKKKGVHPIFGSNMTECDLSTDVAGCEGFNALGFRKRLRHGSPNNDVEESNNIIEEGKLMSLHANQESIVCKSPSFIKNFKMLESAYFLTRERGVKQLGKLSTKSLAPNNSSIGSTLANERSSKVDMAQRRPADDDKRIGWINPFLEGLCKYLSCSRLEVKAEVKQRDLLNSPNLVCALSFDRDGEFFASAGVNKKIKVFDYDSILKGQRAIHYPVVELVSEAKLSSICWNAYIRSQIASSNFEGVVEVWDVTRNQLLSQMKEHERRVWSVDYSALDPTLLASGSDDGFVKLWSVNQDVSLCTIKAKANVCCVQFPPSSSRILAFGSADHKIYYYDLRNPKIPLCTLIGHNKTVSYTKFVDSTNLVSASTDNTLKLWDLSQSSSFPLHDSPTQSFSGHMNMKNFVGLSVFDSYIATGSETNEVYIYHKAFPMPALSFKFNSTDPLSGQETNDAAQFVSSVCWRGQSSTLVASSSTGNIKILEMV